MRILATIPEKGHAHSLKHVDYEHKELSLFPVTRGVLLEVEKAMNLTPATMVKMVKFYDFSHKLYPCVEIDINIFPCVVKNHNGYCVQWFAEEKPSEMSIEEYLTWKKLHVAKWINEQWVYVPVAECESIPLVENQEVAIA